MKDHSHSSIQAHSMGELFPCVIARIERWAPTRSEEFRPLDMDEDWERLQSTSWELTAYGRSEEYATREDAEMVARALLRDAVVRAAWSGRPIDAVEDTAPRAFPHSGNGALMGSRAAARMDAPTMAGREPHASAAWADSATLTRRAGCALSRRRPPCVRRLTGVPTASCAR